MEERQELGYQATKSLGKVEGGERESERREERGEEEEEENRHLHVYES